jgi:hypothetical protein
MSLDITTPDGDLVKWLDKHAETYVNRSTLVIGGSGSGKTTIIFELLELINDQIENGIVIVSKNSRKNYTHRFHEQCIWENITKDELNEIYTRQTDITECYNIANDANNLRALVGRLANRMIHVQLESVRRTSEKIIRQIEESSANESDKLQHIANIRDLAARREKDFCRNIIRAHQTELSRMNLSPPERTTLKYLDLNNNLLILCDDISSLFKTWMRYYKPSEKNPLESIFYDGRHAGVTIIIALHDDTIIDSKLRKNARNVIYGNSQVFISSVNHASAGYSKQEKAFAERIAPHIYRETANVRNYRKICYIREDIHPFRYTIAKTYPVKRFISDALWRVCDQLPKRDHQTKNRFLDEPAEIPEIRRW